MNRGKRQEKKDRGGKRVDSVRKMIVGGEQKKKPNKTESKKKVF